MCVDLLQPPPTHSFLCLYPCCLRWQTWRDTPFTTFHHRAGHHGNCCFSWLLWLMLRYGGGVRTGVCLGGNADERGMSEKMASMSFFFTPSSPPCLSEVTLTRSPDSDPRCDHGETKRAFLLTFTPTTPSVRLHFNLHHMNSVSRSRCLRISRFPQHCLVFIC